MQIARVLLLQATLRRDLVPKSLTQKPMFYFFFFGCQDHVFFMSEQPFVFPPYNSKISDLMAYLSNNN